MGLPRHSTKPPPNSTSQDSFPLAMYKSALSASFLQAATFRQNLWPPCIHSDIEDCSSTTLLARAELKSFAMLDSLVTFVQL
ncbi:hypothetical protein H257_04224 [Aphanomyces astaci]|uniref:Uncharacterized protein n=1 Tax=Aphanomyces astaci TaxID=112090 RepID=W4GUU5_APHAT|nr:hypothetical protein H257_04224 [Aphanomyces astaci]ETV83510.1 hypothetical protein H257_04224 [Aphanomyces astaci]|eukprot:XP_009826940.1 hypothetical protein H257_04224 [Aphanomyces astaci]